MGMVYVVERVVKHEGSDVVGIFDSMEKANECVREEGRKGLRDYYNTREEIQPSGAVRVTISDVHWTTIPWKVL